MPSSSEAVRMLLPSLPPKQSRMKGTMHHQAEKAVDDGGDARQQVHSGL